MSRAMILARPAVAVGLSAVVLGAVVSLLLAWLLSVYATTRSELEHIEPRYARLAGLVRSEKAISQELERVRRRAEKLSIPADSDVDSAGAKLQQNLRRLAEEAGNTVSVSQVLARDEGPETSRLRVMLRVEGNLDNLQRLLTAIEQESPLVFVDSLSISRGRVGGRGADPRSLTIQINLAAHRLATQ